MGSVSYSGYIGPTAIHTVVQNHQIVKQYIRESMREMCYVYKVICLSDITGKDAIESSAMYLSDVYGRDAIENGSMYLLYLVKEGDGYMYICDSDSVILALLDINDCVHFMDASIHREMRINQILEND